MNADSSPTLPSLRPEPPEEWVLLMQQYWADLLEVSYEEVGPRTDLFERGADSFELVYLHTRIEARFEITLPDHALIEAPTPWEMAQMIAEHARAHEPLSIPPPGKAMLRVSQGEPGLLPLIVMPGGDRVFLIDAGWLSRLLQPPRTVLGITAQRDLPLQDHWVEQQAALWVEEILAEVPQGPWLVLSICLGTCLAWEVAGQLATHGPTHLLLLDPMQPGAETPENVGPRWFGSQEYVVRPIDAEVSALMSPNFLHREKRLAPFEAAQGPIPLRILPEEVPAHAFIGGPMRYIVPEVQRWLDMVGSGG